MKFYATVDCDSIRDYMPDVPIMLPASSWSRRNMPPVRLPSHIRDVAADCGGYVATKVWGDYRYTPERYVEWLWSFKPRWAATMDYCCEDEIVAGQPGLVRERQHRTTEMAWHFWETYREVPWVWVPTIQGWTVPNYRAHAREMWWLIGRMAEHYGPRSEFRVGIGTLCRRADSATIREVVHVIADELPGIPLHLWGVKLGFLKAPVRLHEQVTSVDSAAWNNLFASNRPDGGRNRAQASSLSQREWCYRIALPEYLTKVTAALEGTKQVAMAIADEGVA